MKKVAVIGSALIALLLMNSFHISVFAEKEEGFRPAAPKFMPYADILANYLSGPSGRFLENQGKILNEQELQEIKGATQSAGAGGAALVPFRDPSAKFSRNILISRDKGKIPIQTEPHLAVNPRNSDHLLVGLIDYNLPSVGTYVSRDGGATWDGPFQARYLKDDSSSIGDPTVAFDREGNGYISFISYDVKDRSIFGVTYELPVTSIAIAKSQDGGYRWGDSTAVAISEISDTETEYREWGSGKGDVKVISITFLDKPWMTVGPYSKYFDTDVIYVSYTEFALKLRALPLFRDEKGNPTYFFFGLPSLETTIKLVRSVDGGKTWSPPVSVSRTAVTEIGWGYRKETVQGSNVAVAQDGKLYITWLDSLNDEAFKGMAEIQIAISEDRGNRFIVHRAATFLEPAFQSRTANFRSWGSAFPQIAAFGNTSAYIVYTGRSYDESSDGLMDDGDIFFVASDNGGINWTRPKNLSEETANRFQFFPSIAVDKNGTINVMWGDFRDDPSETKFNIYYTKSEDQGKTFGFEQMGVRFESSRVTDFPVNPNNAFPRGAFIGDYFSIKAVKDDVYIVWTDGRLGEFGGINQKIAFARSRPMPNPSIFLSPPRGAGGKAITLQGHNFQPEEHLFIEVSGVLVSEGMMSSKEGRFTTNIFVPISGEGSHSVRVFDATGNLAEASYYMDFGFDTVKKELDKQNNIIEGQKKLVQNLSSTIVQSNEASLVSKEITELRALLNTRSQEIDKKITDKLSVIEEKMIDADSKTKSMVIYTSFLVAVSYVFLVLITILVIRKKIISR